MAVFPMTGGYLRRSDSDESQEKKLKRKVYSALNKGNKEVRHYKFYYGSM